MCTLSLRLRAVFVALALPVLAASCLKATGKPGTGSGGSGSPSGAGATGPGAGGNAGNSGTGGAGGTRVGGVVILPDGTSTPAVAKAACADVTNQQGALTYTPGYSISAAAKSAAANAVQSMTTIQKETQLRGTQPPGSSDIFRTLDDTTDGVKGFQLSDGPRGVCLDPYKGSGNGFSTVFPTGSLRGATFDPDVENQIGAAIGDEALAAGRTLVFAPTVNILRHPAWGRSQETYGEDSFLLGRLGSAFVVGLQNFVPACVKHFAANNIEKNRATDIAQMDEQTLQEIYARHFGMIVRDGGVSSVMAALNEIQPAGQQALNCTQSHHLLTDVLRTEFGFQGFVLSDYWAMPGGQSPSGNQESTDTPQAILAGMEMELPQNLNFMTLDSAVNGGSIAASDLTNAAQLVVNEKYRFNVNSLNGTVGLNTPTTSFNTGTFSITNNDAHIALSEKAAEEGAVLLQNNNGTLPIKSDGSIKTVAVVGLQVGWSLAVGGTGTVDFPKDARIGDLGSSRVDMDPKKAIGPFAGIQAAAPAGVNVVVDDTGGTSVAASADFVVVVAGLTPQDEGEEYTIGPDADRDASLALDGKNGGTTQNNYIKAIAALGKPMAVVLEGGSVIDLSSFQALVPAIVMAWYPGQSGGQAIGNLLWGKSNFSGKLPVTWSALADYPPFSGNGTGGASTTQMSYFLGYRWFTNQGKTPTYPFGYGLSYTTFAYSNLQVPCATVTDGGVVYVSVDVENTGTKDGDEVVFLFVSWPSSAVANRMGAGYKELKGFQRATIPAGKKAQVTIPIRLSDLNYWDTASSSWKIESGPVKVMVGPSSDNLMLSDTFTVQ